MTSNVGERTIVTLPSTDPAVLLWQDGQIVAKLPAENVRRAIATVWSCQTDADCILAEQMCPPGTTVDEATDCYREIPLPPSLGSDASQVIRMLVHPVDGSVWMTNYYVGDELVRYDPSTDEFLQVRLPRGPGAPDPVIGDWPPFPVEIKVASTGDLLYQTQYGNTFGVIRLAKVLDPTSCTALTSPVPGADCTVEVDLNAQPIIDGADPSCVNPCITETVLANGFLPCTPASRDDPACPWASGARNGGLYFGWITRRKEVWFDVANRGVGYIKLQDLRRGRPNFVLMPPSTFHPGGPYSCGPTVGNLGAIAVDESNGSVWYGEYCRKRIARHFPLD